jgi:TolB-like protein
LVQIEPSENRAHTPLRWQESAGNKSAGGQVFISVEAQRKEETYKKKSRPEERISGKPGVGAGQPVEIGTMIEARSAIPVVCFGAFEVDFQSRRLRKHGMRLRLEQQPFQILEMLLNRAGQVVTRKALRQELWPNTIVGYEHCLNTAINKLRELLGDSAKSPRFIETVPRLGYRFIAPAAKLGRASWPAEKKMLMALPFENLSDSRERDYFADGLTEEMISQLGKLDPKRLGVIARTSAVQYQAAKKTIGEIAQELNVDYVLEGSVRRDGKRVRITAQLIETRAQTHLWSGTYDRDLRDVLNVQSEVAGQVGSALALELLPEGSSRPFASEASRTRAV